MKLLLVDAIKLLAILDALIFTSVHRMGEKPVKCFEFVSCVLLHDCNRLCGCLLTTECRLNRAKSKDGRKAPSSHYAYIILKHININA